jgi:competence protein ComEC
MLDHWPSSPSKTLLTAGVAVIFGTAAHAFMGSSVLPWRALNWMTFVVLVIPLVGLIKDIVRCPSPWRRFVIVVTAAFVLAFCRYDWALATTAGFVAPPAGQHRFAGTVQSADGVMTALVVADATMDGAALAFPIKVAGKLPTDLLPGDRVTWTGKPRAAAPADRGQGLVLLGKAGWICDATGLKLERAGEWSIARAFGLARAGLRARVATLMPQTEATLLMGLLTGEQSGLPPKVAQAFRNTGTSHILAVSGYNVTQIVNLALVLFVVAAFPHRRALLAAGVAVMSFTWFVGAGPSVVRAALMGALMLLARRLGRRYDAPIGLTSAAAVMLLANPFILRYDLGFRLSFAAVLGLMTFARPLATRLKWLRSRFLIDALSTTLAATLFTLPISLAEFGVLAYVGPLANLLVAPIIGPLMLIGPAVLLASVIVPWGAPVIGLVAWLPLKMLITIVTLCAVVPPWQVKISALDEACLYAALAAMAWHWRRRPSEEDEELAI